MCTILEFPGKLAASYFVYNLPYFSHVMRCWNCSVINSGHNLHRFYSQARRSKNCCVAFGCSNSPTNHPELSYHTFPKNEVRKEKWISAVKRKGWTPSNSSVLCSAYFSRDSYCRPPGGKQRALLKGDAVTSIFSSYPTYLQSPRHMMKNWN